MERIEIIENEEIKGLLADLKIVDKEIGDLVTESEERQRVFDTKIMIRQKLVDQMKPIVNTEFIGKLAEFELLANLVLNDKGEVEVKIVDELETWKKNYLEKKEVKVKTAEEEVAAIAPEETK